jgi:formylglycine-generating enzyme required for sulfatase activity
MKRILLACLIASLPASLVFHVSAIAQEAGTEASVLGISKVKPESGRFVEYNGIYMVPYIHEIERTNIKFEMLPVPGGEVVVGSPDSEEGRADDEGPQFTVTLPPYWVAKTELTWGEYKTFMRMYDVFKRLAGDGIRTINHENRADAVTVPTPLYDPAHTFEYGEDRYQPAVTMTQYAAKQYTKWLSGITGIEYRLPTEAEWEHAARAGAKTAYCFGDDPSELGKYATFRDNAGRGADKVGSRLPNAFGLHDMHGNVWEWVIDQYDPSGFGDRGGKNLSWKDGTAWPTEQDSRCVKGGGWQDSADRLRAAARMGSADEDWKESDPNIPLSPWWFTTDPARMVGMRLFRSAEPLTPELKKLFWDIDNDTTKEDVAFRLKEGRGAIGLPVPELIKEFQRRAP